MISRVRHTADDHQSHRWHEEPNGALPGGIYDGATEILAITRGEHSASSDQEGRRRRADPLPTSGRKRPLGPLARYIAGFNWVCCTNPALPAHGRGGHGSGGILVNVVSRWGATASYRSMVSSLARCRGICGTGFWKAIRCVIC